MILTTKSYATFDPVREHDAIEAFRKEHPDWIEEEGGTVAIVFRNETWVVINVADDGLIETLN